MPAATTQKPIVTNRRGPSTCTRRDCTHDAVAQVTDARESAIPATVVLVSRTEVNASVT